MVLQPLRAFGLLLLFANLCTSFNCHTCISWICDPNFSAAHCEEMAQMVWESMGGYRQTDDLPFMLVCPEVDNTRLWTSIADYHKENKLNTCKHDGWDLSEARAFCGKTGFYIVVQKSKFSREMVMYGTVMGCTSWKWLKQNCAGGKCVERFCGTDRVVKTSSKKFDNKEFAIHLNICTRGAVNCTNCRECGEESYCIGPEESIVTKPIVQQSGLSAFSYVMIGALILMAVIAGLCCYEPKRRQVHGTFVFDEDLMGVVRKT